MSSGFNTYFLALAIVAVLALLSTDAGTAQSSETAAGRNLVAGLRAEFDPAPNYPDTVDADDALQLTDGRYSSGSNPDIEGVGGTSLWGQRSTVGWQNVVPLTIGFDLGASRRIGGVSLSSAAGAAGVYWPRSIAIMVSDDKKTWRFAGELISLSRGNGLPQIQGYNTHRFVARGLHAQGRYLSFIVAVSGTMYFFTDEIEVYPDTTGQPPANVGPSFDSMDDARRFVIESATRFGVQGRMARDFSTIRGELKSARIGDPLRRELTARLEAAAAQIDAVTVPPAAEFKAIMPVNEPHSQMLKVHAALLSARGLTSLFAWKNHRYDYAEWLSAPPAKPGAPQLDVSLLGAEQRGDAFWVGNASQHHIPLTLSVTPPAGARPGWLRIYQVPWVDTAQSAPMPCALVPLTAEAGKYTFNLPSGLTSKIWCQIDGAALPPGNHQATLQLKAGNKSLNVPLRVQAQALSPALASLKGERLSLRMWDYTDGEGAYGVRPSNIKAVISLARSYGVDVPEATVATVPVPVEADFDANDKLVKPLDFTRFDKWVALWPGAAAYSVFLNQQQKQFAGAPMGTPAFKARVGEWAKAMSRHMVSLNLRPGQLNLLLFDEPRTNEDDAHASQWIAAFKEAAPELVIYSDPVWPDPTRSEYPQMFTLPDILMPNLQVFLRNKELSEKFYLAHQAAGKTLFFYQCTKESRLGDPTRYFRNQSWYAFRYGAKAVCYWSLGDTGQAISSWNEYTGGRGFAYTPAFLDRDSAIGSVQFEAIREGMQDYHTFTLLKEAAARSNSARLRAEAEKLLSPQSMEAAAAGDGVDYTWKTTPAGIHTAPDAVRTRALDLLRQFANELS